MRYKDFSVALASGVCPHLEELILKFSVECLTARFDLGSVLQHCKRLKKVELTRLRVPGYVTSLKYGVLLHRVCLEDVFVTNEEFQEVIENCKQLTAVRLKPINEGVSLTRSASENKIKHFRVTSASFSEFLTCCGHLKSLEVNKCTDTRLVFGVLAQGACSQIQSFTCLDIPQDTIIRLRYLMMLRSLTLQWTIPANDLEIKSVISDLLTLPSVESVFLGLFTTTSEYLSTILDLKSLRKLGIFGNSGFTGLTRMVKRMYDIPCTQEIECLFLVLCKLTWEHIFWFSEAISSGRFPNLKTLIMKDTQLSENTLVFLLEALLKGTCPLLELLDIRGNSIDARACICMSSLQRMYTKLNTIVWS